MAQSHENEKLKLHQFELVEQIGEGGMGEVFLARDTELDRNVALKRLTPVLARDETARKRFLREAKSAAALDHPYICKIYEVGEADGNAYIAMEFVEGETLSAKLAKGPLRLSDVLAYGSEIAEAMEAAHEKNIVHRDLKAPNIMVTRSGHVKVLDFGIALKLQAEDGESKAETLSHRLSSQGATPGTVVYMSPEQVRGEPLDERSDVFALGVVLYEMATGKLPFHGATSGLTYDAILNRGPAPPTSVHPAVPQELERIIMKALEKDREHRYQTVKELQVDLRRLARDTGAGTEAERAGASSGRPVGAAAVAKRGGSPGIALVFSAIALLLVLGTYRFFGGGGEAASIDSLAVLPFENTRNDPEVDYLSDGIPESLINRLSRLPSLDVMARSTAFRYRGSELDPQSVGRELGVAAVVTGRLVQQDDALNVQAELVEVATGRQLWGDQFNRSLDEIATLQGDITRSISRALSVELAADEGRMTADAEAYRAYLRGRFLWNKRTNEDFVRAIGFFETAVERDPGYALAHVGLADCYALLGGQFYGVHPDYPPGPTNEKAREAAGRALELEASLPQAYATLAWIDFLEWDFENAERQFEQAIALDPAYTTAHQWYAYYLSARGRHDEAVREAEIAIELEPESPIHNRTLGNILFQAGRYDEAIAHLREALELDASFPLTRDYLIDSLWLSGERDEAIAAAGEQSESYARFLELVRDGARARARALIEDGSVPAPGPAEELRLTALLGDSDELVSFLEEAFRERQPNLPSLLGSPWVDSLDDGRIDDLRERVGL